MLTLKQTYAPECTVLVWLNTWGSGAIGHPGHAALLVRRVVDEGPWQLNETINAMNLAPGYNDKLIRYFSFWPGEGRAKVIGRGSGKFQNHHLFDYVNEMSAETRQKLENGVLTPRPGQVRIGSREYSPKDTIDIIYSDFYGQSFDEMVAIPCLSGARPWELGLSHNRMVKYAVEFKRSGDFNYVFISRTSNCAGVAVRTLVAGGAEGFCDAVGGAPSPTIYITPSGVLTYAKTLRNGIERVNSWLGYLKNEQVGRKNAIDKKFQDRDTSEIYQYNDWRGDSYVSWYSVRGSVIGGVDTAIQDYHKYTWKDHYPDKMKAFIKIIKGTHSYFQAAQSGKREQAFLTLARQILSVVQKRATNADRPWWQVSFYGR